MLSDGDTMAIVEAYRAIITEYQITLTYNFYMVCIYTFELVLEAMLLLSWDFRCNLDVAEI